MEGVRLAGDELIRTYGISRRLAVRVGALMAKGLTVTPTLLEIAGPGSAVEKLLLHADLLDGADSLTTETAQSLAQATGADDEGPLVVAARNDECVLALEEELLAEEGWQAQEAQQAEADAGALMRRDDDLGVGRVLDRSETEHLFNMEEIARLKLDALAGRSPEERISALRKLLYSPLTAQEKGSVFLRALADSSGAVRSEAIKALESLGFNRDTADALRMIFDGDARKRTQAIRRIGDLLRKLQDAEREIVLLVLAELFRETTLTEADDPLLIVLTEAVPLATPSPRLVSEITRVCVQHLLVGMPAANGAVIAGLGLRETILLLAESAPQPVLEKLWEEVDTVREAPPRATLLTLLIDIEADPTRRATLCDLVVLELLGGDLEELPRQNLGNVLLTLGAPAADALLARYREAGNDARTRLVAFLDMACMDDATDDAVRTDIERELVASLKAANPHLHMEILRTRALNQLALPGDLPAKLTAELTPMLRDTANPERADHAELMLENLGGAAAEGLMTMIRARPSAPEADKAVRALTAIVARADDDAVRALATPVLDLAERRVVDRRNTIGAYAFAVGRIAASGAAGEARAREAFEKVSKCIGLVAYAGDVVDAIGSLGASACVTHEQRVRAVHLLSSLVDRPADDEETGIREIQTDKGPVYEITGNVDFDSETLPAAVRGLEAVALCDDVTDALRTRIAEMFLRVWTGVARWEIVWGPRGAECLSAALAHIGADARTEDRAREHILSALQLAVERISVVRALAVLFEVACDDAPFNTAVVAATEGMLDQWIEPEIAPEELEAVLIAAARAVGRPTLAGRTKRVRELRERTAHLLFDALRRGAVWTQPLLAELRDCPALPKALRSEITDRLKLAFRIGEGVTCMETLQNAQHSPNGSPKVRRVRTGQGVIARTQNG